MIQYPWLKVIYNQILRSYYLNRGHHALILHSKTNYGEDFLIHEIAQWLICANRNNKSYCGTCNNCYLMNKGCHPDYYQLDIDLNTESIGVEKIRNCITELYNSSYCSQSKIVFIKYIENLTYQAISVLLKTIEDPPVNTYFLLRTKNYMNIPITLLSRCIKWIVLPPTESQGLEWLMKKQKDIDILVAQTALRLSYGSPIEANTMFQLNFWQYRIRLCKIFGDVIINENFLDLLPCLSNTYQYNDKPLYWLITLLIDSLKWQQKINKKFLTNLDQLHLISNIAMKWHEFYLNDQVTGWLTLFRYFQKFKYVNHELLLMHQLLNWKLSIIESSF